MKKLILISMFSVACVACGQSDQKPDKSNYSGDVYPNIDRKYDNRNGSNPKNFAVPLDRHHMAPTLHQFDKNASRNVNERSFNADNTGKNIRDRNFMTLTPGDQSESAADRTITQRIRQAIMADNSLSTNAQNIKIITINGVVTLRGPVLNAAERDAILSKVKSIQGTMKVDNQLEVTK